MAILIERVIRWDAVIRVNLLFVPLPLIRSFTLMIRPRFLSIIFDELDMELNNIPHLNFITFRPLGHRTRFFKNNYCTWQLVALAILRSSAVVQIIVE